MCGHVDGRTIHGSLSHPYQVVLILPLHGGSTVVALEVELHSHGLCAVAQVHLVLSEYRGEVQVAGQCDGLTCSIGFLTVGPASQSAALLVEGEVLCGDGVFVALGVGAASGNDVALALHVAQREGNLYRRSLDGLYGKEADVGTALNGQRGCVAHILGADYVLVLHTIAAIAASAALALLGGEGSHGLALGILHGDVAAP